MTFYTIFGDDEVLFEGKLGQYDFLGGSGIPMRLFFANSEVLNSIMWQMYLKALS